MAKDALDTSVVGDKITTDIIGEYYRVTGPIMGRYLLVNEFEQAGQVDAPTEILRRARAL
jgi:replication factor A1